MGVSRSSGSGPMSVSTGSIVAAAAVRAIERQPCVSRERIGIGGRAPLFDERRELCAQLLSPAQALGVGGRRESRIAARDRLDGVEMWRERRRAIRTRLDQVARPLQVSVVRHPELPLAELEQKGRPDCTVGGRIEVPRPEVRHIPDGFVLGERLLQAVEAARAHQGSGLSQAPADVGRRGRRREPRFRAARAQRHGGRERR